MTEATKMSTGGKVGITIVILAILAAVLAFFLWPRKSAAGEKKKDEPGPEPPPGPGPDPMKPTTSPTKGQYYVVHAGDSDVRICQGAGFAPGQISEARKVMREHPRNEWIPKVKDDATTSYNETALNLFAGWAPMVGREIESWAWQTEKLGWGGHKWPIVYVPLDSEVVA
jgi:hypothetical protein